eukprot:scaffold175117_cov23-Cyclotella_meneghiniana.AAC.1
MLSSRHIQSREIALFVYLVFAFLGQKRREKSVKTANQDQKSTSAPIPLRNTNAVYSALGLKSVSDDSQTALDSGFPALSSL